MIGSESAAPRRAKKVPAESLIYEAEKLLDERGYWVIKVDEVEDTSTYHALVAFQKVEGRRRTGVLNETELMALRASRRPSPKRFDSRVHLEIDLSFLVDKNGMVTIILPVCTGNDKRYFHHGKWKTAHTPRGVFRITRQIKGIRAAPLGLMPYPNYFTGGIAIYGSLLIEIYPASHGCVRFHFSPLVNSVSWSLSGCRFSCLQSQSGDS